ncbi:MAG: TIGR03564 family F420-dependent LLM class oxidoreductase [Myxococcota bacterium]
MRIGWNGGGHYSSLEAIRADARRAAEQGFSHFWLSQIMGPESLTALAAIGADAPGIELGTSIVPLYGRHPLVLASQALTTQAALGGRLVLGIGPSHHRLVEHMYGGSYARPFTRTREELQALKTLMAGEALELEGQEITVRGQLAIEASAPPILIAALGPRMLELAGREAEGTALWMVGPRTLAEHIVPRIREAADAAGRPSPRILAGLPVCVTDDPERARAFAAKRLMVYGQLPAYQAMLEREGVSGPEGILAVGSEDEVRDRFFRYAEAGATDLRVSDLCASPEESERTRELLRQMPREFA